MTVGENLSPRWKFGGIYMKRITISLVVITLFMAVHTNIDAAQLNPMEQMMVDELVNIFGGSPQGNPNNGSSQWVCSWCGSSVTSSNSPSKNGCPSKHRYHGWINVGNTGRNTFVCNRCGAVVHTQYKPNSATCTGGGRNGYHQWIQR